MPHNDSAYSQVDSEVGTPFRRNPRSSLLRNGPSGLGSTARAAGYIRTLRRGNARRANQGAFQAREAVFTERASVHSVGNQFAHRRERGGDTPDAHIVEELLEAGGRDAVTGMSTMDMGWSYAHAYEAHRAQRDRPLPYRVGARRGDPMTQLRDDCSLAAEEFMTRMSTRSLFGFGKSDAERMREVTEEHNRYSMMMLSLIAGPVRSGFRFRNIVGATGTAVTLWLVSGHFREMVGDVARDVIDVVPKPLQPLVRKFNLSRTDDMPFTAESAAMTRIGLKESYYDRMRDVMAADLGNFERQNALTELEDEFEATMELLEKRFAQIGLKDRSVDAYERMIVGTRAQLDPAFAAKFEGLSHGRVSRDVFTVEHDAAGHPVRFKPWSGNFIDGAGGNVIDFGAFSVRKPQSKDAHQAEVTIAIQSSIQEHLASGVSPRFFDFELMSAFAGMSVDAETSRRLGLMYPDTGFSRFSPMMHAMAQDGFSPDAAYETILSGIANGVSHAIETDPRMAEVMRQNLREIHYTSEGDVDFEAYLGDMQRAGELYGFLIKQQGIDRGEPVMSAEEFLERYQAHRDSMTKEEFLNYDNDIARQFVDFLRFDNRREESRKQAAEDIAAEVVHTAKNMPELESGSTYYRQNIPGGAEKLRAFVDGKSREYIETMYCVHQAQARGEDAGEAKARFDELNAELTDIVGKQNFAAFSRFTIARGHELLANDVYAHLVAGKPKDDAHEHRVRVVQSLVKSLPVTEGVTLTQGFYDVYLKSRLHDVGDATSMEDIVRLPGETYAEVCEKFGLELTPVGEKANEAVVAARGEATVIAGELESSGVSMSSFAYGLPRDFVQRVDSLAERYVTALYDESEFFDEDARSRYGFEGVRMSSEDIRAQLLKGIPQSRHEDVLALVTARGYELIDAVAYDEMENVTPMRKRRAEFMSADLRATFERWGVGEDCDRPYDALFNSERYGVRLGPGVCASALSEDKGDSSYFETLGEVGVPSTKRARVAEQRRRVMRTIMETRNADKDILTNKDARLHDIQKNGAKKKEKNPLADVRHLLVSKEPERSPGKFQPRDVSMDF